MKDTLTTLKKQWEEFKETLGRLKDECQVEYDRSEYKYLDDGSNPLLEAEHNLDQIEDINGCVKDIDNAIAKIF